MTEWVVGYTNPKREDDVRRELRRRSFEVYVPAMTVTKRRKDVSRPLLPRYVFVGFRAGHTFLDLDQTPGLESVVRDGAQPAQVRPEVVGLLREREASGDFDFSAYKLARLAQCEKIAARERKVADLMGGCAAVVRAGPYSSFTGKFESRLDEERVSILLKLFGREFAIPIALDQIEIRVLRE